MGTSKHCPLLFTFRLTVGGFQWKKNTKVITSNATESLKSQKYSTAGAAPFKTVNVRAVYIRKIQK